MCEAGIMAHQPPSPLQLWWEKEEEKTLFCLILLVHLFFIASEYLITGDPFVADHFSPH